MLSGLEGFPTASRRGCLANGLVGMRYPHSSKVAGRRKERGNTAIDPWHKEDCIITHTHTEAQIHDKTCHCWVCASR